ncbi:MAG: hypothetical protein AB1486_31375 [Planctomycetota bacterium]
MTGVVLSSFVVASTFAAGSVLVVLLRLHGTRVGLAARSFLLGTGALAYQAFLWSLAGLPVSLEALLPVWWVAVAVLWCRRRRARSVRSPPIASTLADRLFWLVVLVLVILALTTALLRPIHTADAANIYGLAARAIAARHELSAGVLHSLQTAGHVEYPPLVALNEALLFMAAGTLAMRLALVLFVFFFASFAVLVHELARELLRPGWAALVSLVLVLSPEVLLYAWRGYADLPLAALFAAAILHGRRAFVAGTPGDAVAAAVFLGFASFTKNEGLAAALLGMGVLLVWALASRRTRVLVGAVLLLLALVAPWPIFRTVHHLEVVDLAGSSLGNLIDEPSRMAVVLSELAGIALRRGLRGDFMWGAFWFVVAGVGLAVVVINMRHPSRLGRQLVLPALPLIVQLAVYVTVLAVTGNDLRWQLETALSRLVLHTTPAALLLLASGFASVSKAALTGCGGSTTGRLPGVRAIG